MRAKPLISANMVTTARLVAMVPLGWAVYQGPTGWLWALILGTLIGCTDFVDGYIARKYGPTVLGGLLDPIADKMLIAAWYLPFVHIGLLPAWPVAVMFLREFLVTALRSAFAQRDLQMKTSYLAKVKTWAQMQGLGVIVLMFLLESRREVMEWMLGVGAVLPVIVAVVFFAIKRRIYAGAIIMAALQAAVFGLYVSLELRTMVEVVLISIVVLTWLSGADYLLTGFPRLRKAGDFSRSDFVRILSALALPISVVVCLVRVEAMVAGIACMFILGIELAVGGLDNLLSHHRVQSGAFAWSSRALAIPGLLIGAVVLSELGQASWSAPLALAALAVSVAGGAVEFWRGRDYYLDARLRAKAEDAAASVA